MFYTCPGARRTTGTDISAPRPVQRADGADGADAEVGAAPTAQPSCTVSAADLALTAVVKHVGDRTAGGEDPRVQYLGTAATTGPWQNLDQKVLWG